MSINNGFHVTELEMAEAGNKNDVQKVYSCDEAINLAGIGWYTRGLLATLSLSLLSMAIDMFGFSVVVTGCACDFDLDHPQKSILISTPFLGPIIMSYFWGYVSDTQGRKWSLLIGLWGGFIASIISAFSTHWYMLAVLKIIGTSLSSSAQSATFTFLGESCPERAKGTYILIMMSALMLFILSYDVPAYFILNLNFHYDWGFITFSPWRLLTLVIAAPLGTSALMLHFFCESPKFLLNAGKEEAALAHLKTIWRRNGNVGKYPVAKVVLNEETRIKRKEDSILVSLFDQVLPLFKPPLLWRTLQLFYLTAVVYAVNNSLVMWMPIIVEAFTAGLNSPDDGRPRSLCNIIVNSKNITGDIETITCISTIDKRTLISGVAHGLIFATVTLGISRVGHRKKLLVMTFLLIPLLCSLAAVYNENNVASLVLYVGMLMTNFCMGFMFGYFVDLYPTSYRGMAACLGVMISRISGLAGVHFVGAFVMSHCTMTFYAFAIYLLSGIFMAYFLPPDIVPKQVV